MPKEHQCGQCHKKFKHASLLQRHQETHMITGDWMCGLCNCLCNRLSALTLHWQNSCPEFKMVFLDDEIKQMSTDDLREAAFRLILDRYYEDNYDTPGTSKQSLESKKSMNSLCIYCNLLLPKGTMNQHYGVHTNRHGPGELCSSSVVRYVCDLCGYGFRFKKSLFVHWRQKCEEISANCPPHGVLINNRQLKQLVGDLTRRAEINSPCETLVCKRREEIEADDSEDEETKPEFTAQTIPIDIRDVHIWNVANINEKFQCEHCRRSFHSMGRLERHTNSIHQEMKKHVYCELCQSRFSNNRILMAHMRGPCKAMRIEEPDETKRKRLSAEEIQKVVNSAKHNWATLLDNKRAELVRFITSYLNDLDMKMRQNAPQFENAVILESFIPTSAYSDTGYGADTCELCRIKFNSPRFLYQHQQLVHANQREEPSRNQLTITASSLLPYFKLPESTFYDIDGREYHLGKLLERGNEIAKHLKDRLLEAGVKAPKLDANNCFIVQLIGGDRQYILLNEHEFPEVCDKNGVLKPLYFSNPKLFDDIPILEKCA